MTTANYSKATLNALDPNLRTRYDDAFLRNEIINVRKQVDVLHDTMMNFMTRMEKRFTYQEEERKKILNRLTRLENHCKVESGFGSGNKTATAALNLEGAFSGNKRRKSDTPNKLQSQLGNLPDGMIIHDEHGNQLGQIVTVDSTEADSLGSVTLIHVQETEEQAVEIQSETGEEMAGEYSEEFAEAETEPEPDLEPEAEPEGEPEGTDSSGVDSQVTVSSERPRSSSRKEMTVASGLIDWDRIEAESRTMLYLPERKGKGGKVSGRLGQGSPAWTHLLRRAICRSIGEEGMLRYAREGSRTFKMEQEDLFNEIKDRVVNFCKKNNLAVPDDKLMDEIAWAFLRNKKRYRAKPVV